jgi:hypothetical protein
MKVWIGFDCYDNGCDVYNTVKKVFDDEVKALLWSEDPDFLAAAERYNDTPIEWREYEEMEVE